MKITRFIDKKNKPNLSEATWKYWVVALYISDKVEQLAVVQFSELSRNLDRWSAKFEELRLLKGFPIQHHAFQHYRKLNKGHPKSHECMRSKKTKDVILGQPRKSIKGCRVCFGELDQPKVICKKCSKKLVIGKVNQGKQFVYGLYAGDGKLLYIGMTRSPRVRVSEHYASKKFHHMKILAEFDERSEASDFEIFSIDYLKPPLNILVLKPKEDVPEEWRLEVVKFGEVSNRKRYHQIQTEVPTPRRAK